MNWPNMCTVITTGRSTFKNKISISLQENVKCDSHITQFLALENILLKCNHKCLICQHLQGPRPQRFKHMRVAKSSSKHQKI